MDEKRTTRQNAALHLWFTLLAKSLNDAGLDQRKVLKPSVSIPWDARAVKEQLWRPIQKIQVHKNSTRILTSEDIDKVYDTLNRHLGEKFGVTQEFPSLDALSREDMMREGLSDFMENNQK